MAFSPGAILTATQLNARIPESTRTTWSSPVAGGITQGSGTIQADYFQTGPIIFCQFRFIFGAGSAITGSVTLDLPVDAAFQDTSLGWGQMFDTSATALYAVATIATTSTTVGVRAIDTTSTAGLTTALSSTVPFTWASGDVLAVSLQYFYA